MSAWLPGAVVLAAAGALGWLVARQLVTQTPTPGSAPRSLAAGPVHLASGSQWARARPPRLPGLTVLSAWTPYSGFSVKVSVSLLARDAALPALAELSRHASGGLPRPHTTRVAGLGVREFPGINVDRLSVDLYLLATTRGFVALACTRQRAEPDVAGSCVDSVESITVDGARPLRSSDMPLGRGADATLRKLNADRSAARAAFRRAKVPRRQALAARQLWHAHATAAARIAPLAPVSEAAARLSAALRETAAAYRRLSFAGRSGDRPRWRQAKRKVAAAEQVLRQRLSSAP